MNAQAREAIRFMSFYPTDRILGIGCHERDWGDVLFQRPADAPGPMGDIEMANEMATVGWWT